MKCTICGRYAEWKGPLTSLTHIQCNNCGAINRYEKDCVDYNEQENQPPEFKTLLIRAFNSGYMLGHHDTVESCFTDIHAVDMDTYHTDIVEEMFPIT